MKAFSLFVATKRGGKTFKRYYIHSACHIIYPAHGFITNRNRSMKRQIIKQAADCFLCFFKTMLCPSRIRVLQAKLIKYGFGDMILTVIDIHINHGIAGYSYNADTFTGRIYRDYKDCVSLPGKPFLIIRFFLHLSRLIHSQYQQVNAAAVIGIDLSVDCHPVILPLNRGQSGFGPDNLYRFPLCQKPCLRRFSFRRCQYLGPA